MFDISTLITDRTQADVQAWNDKGTYNPSDLNRVTHAMEYLVERIRSYGYSVNYEKVKVPHQPQKGRNRLPAGYTELEYIESTGTQYIDTGFKPNQDTRIVLKYGGCTSSSWTEVFGAGQSVTNPVGNFLIVQNSSGGVQAQYGSEYYTTNATADGDVVDVNKNRFYINDSLVSTFTYTTFASPYTLRLFDANTQREDYPRYSGKIYSCQIYDNGTLIRDFVPCTNASGTVGLYDFVSDVFYANAGTGVFTAGAEVELPPVEILDDYTWYHSDIPQTNELNAYLQNVKWLRESMVLYPNTPEVPADMQGFTFAEANDIEQILINIETIINLMLSSIIYTGEIFSGEVI